MAAGWGICTSSAAVMSQARVLIVDDNDMNIQLAEFVLLAAEYEVESAASAAEAVTRVRDFEPNLILMDVQMSGTDGLELMRRLKADPAKQHIVVVAFTAFAMKGDELKMRTGGCDGYIAKPIDVRTFA